MMTLSEAASVLGGRLVGADATFAAVSSDTRRIERGDLFIALQGPHFDGHDFLEQAKAAGAVGALTSRVMDASVAQVVVDDTRLALGRLAAYWRRRFQLPVVAVTGSNGKTTVKNMLASILGQATPALVTQGNLNNDIGMPLTLLRLHAEHAYAVIEMGMNHAGEIDYLTRIARPTVAVITNAGAAHLAGLGSVENVARAKGEIFAGLAEGGVAVINADDPHAPLWHALAATHRRMTFGAKTEADVRVDYRAQADGAEIRLTTPAGTADVRLLLLGRHNALNAAAATAAALAAGADLSAVTTGLAGLHPAPGRLELKRARHARVLDDTYNANPSSLAAGIAVLADMPGRRVLVLGDMAELGPESAQWHREAGAKARAAGVERLYALGENAREAVAAFGDGGRHFTERTALIDALRADWQNDMTILVKGSRVMQMEKVVAALTDGEEKN